MKHTFTVGCFGIITDKDKRILLCHRRDYDLWNLPGGAMETNETPWECVVREVKEETGLEVTVTKLQGVYSKPEKDDLVFSFECEVLGGKIRLNDESDEIKYFPIDSLPVNTIPKQVERLKDYFDKAENTVLKEQSGISSVSLLNKNSV